MTISADEVRRLVSTLEKFLDLMSDPNWQETLGSFVEREKALRMREHVAAAREAEAAEGAARFRQKIAELVKAEAA
jgi:hypothetical protein